MRKRYVLAQLPLLNGIPWKPNTPPTIEPFREARTINGLWCLGRTSATTIPSSGHPSSRETHEININYEKAESS